MKASSGTVRATGGGALTSRKPGNASQAGRAPARSATQHEVKGANRSPHLSDFQAQQPVLPFHKIIPSDPTLLDDAVAGIRAAIDRTACSEEVEDITLAAREAVANAIVHGNHCDPAKAVGVSVAANENCDLLIVVRDGGSGFDPSKLPDPTAAENLLANHGGGIFLMKQLMDEVDFKFDHGTEVRMLRRRQWLE